MPDNPITKLANAIKQLIIDHDKQASSSQRGHATAGGTPQSIGDDLSAGTDNGYYARADHVHTASWTNLKNKPTIPSASSTTPSADISGGAVGTGTTWAKADHQHPLSNAYATSIHTHGNITNDGKIGSTSNLPIVTGDNGTLTTGNTGIAYGQVDNTSTSTVFTATVNGITSLQDGVSVMLRNGVITSAEGFTLNVNGLGAKPVYNSMADATRDTTIFNINYTMLFVYDSTRVENGCWICYRGYNSDKDTNTIGYQIRTNSSTYTATDKFVRYRLLLEVDNGHYMPVNTSTSTSATASKSSTMNTREFKIGGRIMYYGTTAAVSANTQIAGIAYLWTQINLVLGYSFSNSSSGPSLTTGEPVYMVAKPSTTNKGMAKLNTPYYTQSLPSTADGLIYIYLGQATDATHIELVLDHPIYEYHGSGIRLYRDYYDSNEIDTLLNSKSDVGHTHSDYINPTIVDNLTTDDATKVLSAKQGKVLQDNKLEKVHSSYKGKNVVTNASTGAIEFENKYSHPSTHASSMITDSNTYNNIGNTANTLDNILSNINSKLGTLATIDLVEVTTNKGTASASTMNKLYLVAESSGATNDNYEIFVTVRTGTSPNYSYAWEKVDTARIDLSGYLTTSNASSTYLSKTDASSTYVAKETGKGLFSGSYSDLTNKPSYSATVTSSTTDSVKIGSININGSNVDIYATNTVYTHPSTHPASMITGLATVATSGKASDLTNDNNTFATGNHNHSGTYVDGVTGNNTTNGSAIAEIKANTTSKGTIYHPKINNANLTGVPTSNQTLSFGGNFKVNQVNANTDGHVTGLTERTLTLPSLPNIPQSLGDLELEEGTSVNISSGNILADYDSLNNSVSLLDGMLYYDMSNQSIMYNGTDVIATLSDIPTVPTASTTVPLKDSANGSYGSGTSYARSNHSHPKSDLYVTSIALVPKSSDATGAITLYYGDEPS